MKTNKVFIAMLTIMVISASVFSQRSVYSSGDKSSTEIACSQKQFKSLISDLKSSLADLQKQQDKLVARYLRNPQGLEQVIRANDSLIIQYQKKIENLEDQQIQFVVNAAGKDKKQNIALKSYDVEEFANAYLTVKYADNIGAPENTEKKLFGVVENATYLNPVVVRICGPANFLLEFTLKAKEKSQAFDIPMIGSYTATFISRAGQASVTKRVWPTARYFDEGKQIDFKATYIY